MVLLSLFLAAFVGRDTKQQSDEPIGSGIVFYDGVCALCNGFVRWVARNDRRGIFRFAPLQGTTALEQSITLGAKPSAWSILLKQDGAVYDRSTAALRIMTLLPGWSDAGKLLSGIPIFIRDIVYGFVARIRYSVFGKTNTCPLPETELKKRLLP
jgi:predicted DCC family thiol-disulfide oxidoreductase YuxK